MAAESRRGASPEGEWQGLKRELVAQLYILGGTLALLWAIEIVDLAVFQGGLDGYGIRPRSAVGLIGILLAPFLHGGLRHLMANSGPLVALGWMVMLRDTRHFFVVGAIASVVGGLGVWLIGASGSVHIGASITIFGFFGYLLLRGWFERRFAVIAGSVVVGLLYGGLIFGVLPGQRGISWEGHLFGFLGGVLSARLLTPRQARRKKS